jgi:hypothetical protein
VIRRISRSSIAHTKTADITWRYPRQLNIGVIELGDQRAGMGQSEAELTARTVPW